MRQMHKIGDKKMIRIIPVTPPDMARHESIFIPLFQKQPLEQEEFFSLLALSTRNALAEFFRHEFKAGEQETKMLWLPSGNIRRVVLFGLGDRGAWNERRQHLLSRRMVRFATSNRIEKFGTPLPSFFSGSTEERARAWAVNAIMADFEFDGYKEPPKEKLPRINTIALAVSSRDKQQAAKGIREGAIIGEETNAARALANTPGSDMTPALLAKEAVSTAKRAGMRATVLDVSAMKRIGMGAILGVGRGSTEPPRFIILEYIKGKKDKKPMVLAGKGVTFDTGGLNLKPDNYIYEMHMDMSGGAAVIHGMAAVARLKLPINIVGLIPAVENMPSGSSYRPGDLLKSLSGKTIEVLNTDAEGRVILADALTYGLRYKPEIMIDIATLTGAAHVALGNYCSAVFSNDEPLQKNLVEIGARSGDYVWPLPLWDEYLPEIRGTFGDLANTAKGDRYGGAIHGAKFLEQFAGNTRFAHIDIAPRMTTVESEFLAKGASGVGVKFIAELGKHNAENN